MKAITTTSVTLANGTTTAGELVQLLTSVPSTATVRISQAPRYNNPTDPGGEVTIRVDHPAGSSPQQVGSRWPAIWVSSIPQSNDGQPPADDSTGRNQP